MNTAFHNFAKRGWRRSRRGNWWRRLSNGELITIFWRDNGYKTCIVMSDDSVHFSEATFPTLLSAKLSVYKSFAHYLAGEREYAR